MSAGEGKIALNITSHPSRLAPTRQEIEALARQIGFDEDTVGRIGLVVNEAMANVIRHAYQGRTDQPMEVEASSTGGAGAPAEQGPDKTAGPGIRITIRDWGSGIDPSTLLAAPKDPLKPGGLGLICMREMMDSVKFEPQAKGMRLVMTKLLKTATATTAKTNTATAKTNAQMEGGADHA